MPSICQLHRVRLTLDDLLGLVKSSVSELQGIRKEDMKLIVTDPRTREVVIEICVEEASAIPDPTTGGIG